MRKITQQFLRLMFNENERICVSDSKFGYWSLNFNDAIKDTVTLVSPNQNIPIREIKSDNLIFVALNPMKEGFRLDSNVVSYRNFLIEIDGHSRELQLKYFKDCGIPISAMVWSGSKSIHLLISLSGDGLPNDKSYRYIYKWILNVLTMTDQALGNSSRSIRLPGAIRPETGREQELIELNGRIDPKLLVSWLKKYRFSAPIPSKSRKIKKSGATPDMSQIKPWVAKLLKDGVKSNRNHTWFSIGAEFCVMGYSEEEAIDKLESYFSEESDFKEKEWLMAIASGYRHINEK